MEEIKGPRRLAKAIDLKSRMDRKIKEKIATIDLGIKNEHVNECVKLNEAMVQQCELGSVINPIAPDLALKRFMKWCIEQLSMFRVIRARQLRVMSDMQAEINELKLAVYGEEDPPPPTQIKQESGDGKQGEGTQTEARP